MNVDDFKIAIPEGDMLETIFKHQTELMNKYDAIEEANMQTTYPHGVFDIHNKYAQIRLKEFAWRVTEEIAEATECYNPVFPTGKFSVGTVDDDDLGRGTATVNTHFYEELIDALHFFVELLIHSGFTPKILHDELEYGFPATDDLMRNIFHRTPGSEARSRSVNELAWLTVEGIGKAMNCLKNKPWKQSHMMTDEKHYREELIRGFDNFIDLLVKVGFDATSTTEMYLNKNAVNQFRIRSKY